MNAKTPTDIIAAYDAIGPNSNRADINAAYSTFGGANAPSAILNGASQIIPRWSADGRRHSRGSLYTSCWPSSCAAADLRHDPVWHPVAVAVMHAAHRIAYAV